MDIHNKIEVCIVRIMYSGKSVSCMFNVQQGGTAHITRESSVSERIKWLLHTGENTAINVDSGEKVCHSSSSVTVFGHTLRVVSSKPC